MVSLKIAKSAASDVSELTLKQAPARLLTFVEAVAADPAIGNVFRTQLSWTDARAKEGWALLAALHAASVVAPDFENPAVAAMKGCEAWQSTGLLRARAMLQATHPDQALFLFHDFVLGKGMEAVSNVSTFLVRRERLAHGPERKASRKADAEALAIIEESGTSKQTVKDLEAMVHTAQSTGEAKEELTDHERKAKRLEALREIHVWVTMWSDMARTVVKRRSQMIRLGIAKRRARTKAVALPPGSAPPVATPPAATPPVPVMTPPSLPSLPPSPAAEDNGPQSRAA